MRFELVGAVMVVVHARQDPSVAEWNSFDSFVRKYLQQTERLFVYSAGGAPSVQQRRQLSEVTWGNKTPGALVMASRISRAIAVAVSWFHPHFRVFNPEEVRNAFEFLRLEGDEAKAVLACLRRLAGHLDVAVRQLSL